MNWQDQEKKECPFCRTDATVSVNRDTLQSMFSGCLCGKFIIDQIALEDAGEYNKILKTDENKILFSGYLRNNQTITVTEEFISEELKGILDYCQGIPLNEKISRIENYIYQKTTSIGKSVPLEVEKLYTLFYLKTHSELVKLLIYLRDTNILHNTPMDTGPTANAILTVDGFSKIEKNVEQSQSEADKKTKKNTPQKARKNVQKTQEKAQTQKVTDEEKSSIDKASSKKKENKKFNDYNNVKPFQLLNYLINRKLAISTVGTDEIEKVNELMKYERLPWQVGPPMQTGDLLLIYISKSIIKNFIGHSELGQLKSDGLHLIFVAAGKSKPLDKKSKRNYEVTIHNRLIIKNPISKEMLIQNKVLGKWGPVKMNFRSVGQNNQFVDSNIAEELWRLILETNPDLIPSLSTIVNREFSPEQSIEDEEESYHKGDDKIPFHLDQVENIDRLNREPIAKSLARLLNNQIFKKNGKSKKKNKMGCSFMVHLQGAWGDGKSTFLKLLGKHLGPNWVIVDFNAWRHQHMDPPWWILMDSIYKAIQGSKGHKFGIWWKERWWRLIRLNSLYWISFFAIIFVFMVVNIIFDFELLKFNSPKFDGKIISAITSYISIVGSIWLLIKSISKTLISASADAANEFKEKARDSMQELKKHYGEIINYTNNHVAVFIDDLDRCNATFAVELLEGMQTLFKDQPVLYVVAGDRHWLTTCFENYYQSYKGVAREPGQRLGYLFLEKAFQLSLRLPKVSGETKKEYWEFILNPQNKKKMHADDLTRENKKEQVKDRISKNYLQTDFSDPQSMRKIIEEHDLNFEEATDIVLEVMDSSTEDVKHLLKNHHHLIDANPRGIKRMANQYTVYRNILTAEGKNFDRDKLFRWLILQNKYPVYTDWLEEHLLDYEKGKKFPDDLKRLEEDERWKLLMYDEDNSKGGVMSPEDISLFTDTELHIENKENIGPDLPS